MLFSLFQGVNVVENHKEPEDFPQLGDEAFTHETLLYYVPKRNRRVSHEYEFEEYAPAPVRYKVRLYNNILNSEQRLYLRAERTRGSNLKVGVYQANRRIGDVKHWASRNVALWLMTWFDGGIFILEDFVWDDEALSFELSFPKEMDQHSPISDLELLERLGTETLFSVNFQDLPDDVISSLSSDGSYYGHISFHCVELENSMRLLIGSEFSEPFELESTDRPQIAKITPETRVHSYCRIETFVFHYELKLFGSFRSTINADEQLMTLETWRHASNRTSIEPEIK
jgi:hypothetical protein